MPTHTHTYTPTHTHTPLHNKLWPTESSTAGPQHAFTDPITGQRSHDRPILPPYSAGPPPTHSPHPHPHSLILPSSHPLCSAVISHLLCSKWPLTALTFPPFVRLHRQRVSQSQPCVDLPRCSDQTSVIYSESRKLFSLCSSSGIHSIPFKVLAQIDNRSIFSLRLPSS